MSTSRQPSTPTPTISWAADTDGNWSTKADWSTGNLPASTDDVSINTLDLHTITFNTGTATVHSLTVGNDNFTVSGGALSITSSAAFANLLTISAGTLAFGAGNASIASFAQSGGALDGTGTVTVSGAATFTGTDQQTGAGTTVLKGLSTVNGVLAPSGNRTIENHGTLNWTGGFWQPNSATFKNDAGATVDINVGAGFNFGINNATGANTFVNAGLLEMTSGTGNTIIYVPFTNTGTVNVQAGTLDLNGGGSSNASAFTVASGATLDFGDSLFFNGPLVDPTFTMTGGTYNVAGATEVIGSTVDFSAATIASFGSQGLFIGGTIGGTLKLGANSVSITTFTQNGFTSTSPAVLDGTGTVTITGAATFGGGTQSGTGTTVLEGNSTFNGNFGLSSGRILENQGTATWTGDDFLGLNGATLKNDAGGTINIESGLEFQAVTGTDAIINAGTFEKTGDQGTALIFVPFINTGTVSVQSGTLELGGGGSSIASAFTVASGATLEFFGGTFTMNGGTYNVAGGTFIAGGTVDFSGATVTSFSSLGIGFLGGTFMLGANNVKIGSLSMDAGDLNGTGTATVTGTATFAQGSEYQTGSGATVLRGSSTVQSNAAVFLSGGRTLENKGTLTWTGGYFTLGSVSGSSIGSGTLKNDAGATFNIESDSAVYLGYTGSLFSNAGLLEKTVTSGTTTINASFANTGTISIQTGTLSFAGTSNRFGGAISGAGTLAFSSGTATLNAGLSIKTSNWTIASGVTVAEKTRVSFAGNFTDTASALNLGGTVLTLSGASSFTGSAINGTGSLVTKGATTVAGLTVGGAMKWLNYGTATEGAQVTIGDANGKTATIINKAGSTWNITADVGIAPIAGGSGSFSNSGVLKKTGGTGTSTIGTSVINAKTIIVTSGTFDLARAVTGTGAMVVANNAKLELDGSVAATQTVAFDFGGGTLALTRTGAFKAGIAGFGTGDTLDLTRFRFSAGEIISFTENAAKTQGVLTVTDGALKASITLFGQYVAAGFATAHDSGTGTAITYTPPPASLPELAANHH